jgi:hypothetical protein
MKTVTFTVEPGHTYVGRVDGGAPFFIGQRVSFEGRIGLANERGTPAQRYDRAQFRPLFGFWADFIHPTAMAEGGLFHTLNTYDRARFTFAFLQYAAHEPNGDFIIYLRELLTLPLAPEYFPELRVENGRVCRVTGAGVEQLESDDSTEPLMNFLNPTSAAIEDEEVVQSAKFVHWAQNDPAHQRVQVDTGVQLFRSNMIRYAKRFGLNARPDTTCLMVADILHQGRGSAAAIKAALADAHPLEMLLHIGAAKFPERIATLRTEIDRLTADGTFGTRVYSVAANDFVPA